MNRNSAQTAMGDRYVPEGTKTSRLKFNASIQSATRQAMELDPNVFVFGIGVDGKGGVFGSTKGLVDIFGSKRVFDTPASEQALTALAAGAANAGMRPVLVHQRIDFMLYSMDQIANWISLWHFKSAGRNSMPLTIRAIVGKGWGQGPQHAKSLHTWFAHVPGLKVVMPSSPADAKGLLLASIFSDDPVIVIESRALFDMEEDVPDDPYLIPLGKALIRRSGDAVTVATFGSMTPPCLQAADELAAKGIEAEIVDLRTLAPLDVESVVASVRRTGRLVVAEPGWKFYGAAAEVIASVSEAVGTEMKARPRRVTWPHSHVPMSSPLEAAFYPTAKDVVAACEAAVAGC